MLSPDLLKKIRQLEIRTAHLVTDALAGEYQSTFKGRGMEFEETRVYVPGDDVRNIDWNTTARSGVPHVKSFREERELTVNLLVDVSASGIFGSGKRTKTEVAAEVAAILAHVAMRKNDKVGAILFTDKIEEYIPPKKGRAHVWRVIREILTHKPSGRGTSIRNALDFLNQVILRRSVVFLISDFLDQDFEQTLLVTSKKHDVIAITITDPREEKFPKVGFVELEDAETGKRILVDSSNSQVSGQIIQMAKERRKKREQLFQSVGLDSIDIQTQGSTIDPILTFFHKRVRQIRR